MNDEYKGILLAILRRAVPAALAMAIGVGILLGANDAFSMLLGFLFFFIAALFVAGPIARLLAEPVGGLLWPKKFYDKPRPMYGIPQSRRAKGLPEEAIAEYAQIAAEFPDEILPHIEMIDIALTELHDPERAEAYFQHGLVALKKPGDKELLEQVYAATRERQAPHPVRHIEMHPTS